MDAAIAVTLAGQPQRAAVFGYRTDAPMIGIAAPARRLGWFAGETATARLTPAGERLLEAALRWAVSW